MRSLIPLSAADQAASAWRWLASASRLAASGWLLSRSPMILAGVGQSSGSTAVSLVALWFLLRRGRVRPRLTPLSGLLPAVLFRSIVRLMLAETPRIETDRNEEAQMEN